jgi:flagellar biosynthetic protein FliS
MTEDEIIKKTPGELIELLYARACQDLTGALVFFREAKPEAQAQAIHLVVHAQQIVAEIQRSTVKGTALAENLNNLYSYCLERMNKACLETDPAPAREVLGLLTELHEAWKILLEKHKNAGAVQA